MPIHWQVAYGVFVVLIFSGCGPSNRPADLPTLNPCEIKITQEEKPLFEATVTLVQVSSADGQHWFPVGSADKNGMAIIYTNGRYVGAPEGKFTVIIQKTVEGASKLGNPPSEDSPEYVSWARQSADEVVPSYSLVEFKYTDPKKTPYEIEIKKGKNVFSFDVGKSVRDLIKTK